MKLYGIAIAIVPAKDQPNVLNATCTPIAVSNTHMDTFEILDKLAFKTTFNTQDTQQIINSFIKTVDTVDAVVALQKQSCAQEGVAYRPIALEVGEDSRHPIHLNALYQHLFGERFTAPLSVDPEKLADEYARNLWNMGRQASEPTYDNWNANEQKSFRDSDIVRKQVPFIMAKNSELESEVAASESIRNNFLQRHGKMPDNFLKAAKKLAELMKECTLQEGSFTKKNDFFAPDYDVKTLKQTPLDSEIIELKSQLEGGEFSAHYRLQEIAKEKGKEFGKITNRSPFTFQYLAPPGYAKDKEMQEKCPHYSFYYWDEAYKQAFYDGFKETYLGPHNRRLKLPLDPPSPPFVDPCADMIRDQLEIIKGRRADDGVLDNPTWRMKIKNSAEQTISRV